MYCETINLISGLKNSNATYTIGTNATKRFFISLTKNSGISLVANVTNATGIMNGTLDIEYSNDGINFSTLDYANLVINSANWTSGWIKSQWTGKYISVLFTKNNMTGGTLELSLTLKGNDC